MKLSVEIPQKVSQGLNGGTFSGISAESVTGAKPWNFPWDFHREFHRDYAVEFFIKLPQGEENVSNDGKRGHQ